MGWNLDDDEDNQLVLLFDLALTDGPQEVRRGDEEIVILSLDDDERRGGKKPGFIGHLLSIPPSDDLDLTRDRSPMRDIDLGE